MASQASGVFDIASTIQSASINRHPSVAHDVNPGTAASKKDPVSIDPAGTFSDVEEDEVPLSVLRPLPRNQNLPPLPDLRFEQSYLRSIEKTDGWGGVLWITLRDQVLLPLAQGTMWSLVLFGWRHWNRASQLSGATVGARIRRWWWGVNNWPLPGEKDRRFMSKNSSRGYSR